MVDEKTANSSVYATKKRFLVDSDIVDEHFVGELRVIDFETGPVSGHGYVQ